MIKPEDAGYFEGRVFHFNYPIEMLPGRVMDAIDLSEVRVDTRNDETITDYDIVHAILNRSLVEPAGDDD